MIMQGRRLPHPKAHFLADSWGPLPRGCPKLGGAGILHVQVPAAVVPLACSHTSVRARATNKRLHLDRRVLANKQPRLALHSHVWNKGRARDGTGWALA